METGAGVPGYSGGLAAAPNGFLEPCCSGRGDEQGEVFVFDLHVLTAMELEAE